MEHGGRPHLEKHGSPTYTADTAAPGSRLAMDFTGALGLLLHRIASAGRPTTTSFSRPGSVSIEWERPHVHRL